MWVKGNLHSHTTVSDGDTDPGEACRHYAEHGYHFLSITDHNTFVDPRSINSHGLILVPGEELTLVPEEDHGIPLHVNGFGVDREIRANRGITRAETIQNCIDAIVGAGGIAQINHPNFYYAFDHTIIAQTSGAMLLEVYNAHPLCFNEGDAGHIAVETMWDNLLSAGHILYGTAVDDTHHYTDIAPHRANPFGGWIWARVGKLTVDEILSALKRGDFYASNGVELRECDARRNELSLAIRPNDGLSYITHFIGDSGRIVHQTSDLDSSFTLPRDGSLTYVRARITASDGTRAWTQPLRNF